MIRFITLARQPRLRPQKISMGCWTNVRVRRRAGSAKCYIFDFIRDFKRRVRVWCARARVRVTYAVQLVWFHFHEAWLAGPSGTCQRISYSAAVWPISPNNYKCNVIDADRHRYVVVLALWSRSQSKTYGRPCELMTSNLTNYQSHLHRRGWPCKIDTAGRPYTGPGPAVG